MKAERPKTGTREWATKSYNCCTGCSHDCRYCVSPKTLILMSDGTTQYIKDLKVGDTIIGTEKKHGLRYFCESIVQNIWTTNKPKFVIKLENGTALECSADHRWLTDRGWRNTARKGRRCWRPCLSEKNRISSIGNLFLTPKETTPYKAGYLYGAIRGDGTHGKYEYGTKKHHRKQFVFRQANIDPEIVKTVKKYMQEILGIETYDFLFKNKSCKMFAIRTNKKSHHHRISFFLTRFNPCSLQPKKPQRARERARGFLAGIFDAEGSSEKRATNIRISNKNETVLKQIERALDIFKFKHTRDASKENGCCSIRLVGGRQEYVRFFSLIHPRISRKFRLAGGHVKGGSRVVSVSRKSRVTYTLYDIETSTGDFIANGSVAHNCYARFAAVDRFHRFPKEEWKIERPREKDAKRKHPLYDGNVMFPTTHDITPGNLDVCLLALKNLLEAGNKVLVVSKPHLECIGKICSSLANHKDKLTFRFTIGATDDNILGYWEPGAPKFQERLDSLKLAFEAGFNTSISAEPLLDPANVMTLWNTLIPFVVSEFWIGKLNKAEKRVEAKTSSDIGMLESLTRWQTDDEVLAIYTRLKDEPKVRWKDSYKEVLRTKGIVLCGTTSATA